MSAQQARKYKEALKAEVVREIKKQAKAGANIDFIQRVVYAQFPSQLWLDWVNVANAEINKVASLN